MEYINIKETNLHVSQIGLGCMRVASLTDSEREKLILTALEEGINFFDHADIYGKGQSEILFGNAIKRANVKREDIIIQSKCGIRKGFFDFSKEYILQSVDGILKRLDIEYLDSLLLHRPDALVEPEEVAEAFNALHQSGKVRYFGVSNHNPMQIELLQKYTSHKIAINQLQLSIAHTPMIKAGLNVNMENESGVNRDGSVLDYCRLKDITIQPWSPFQYGSFEGTFLGNEKYGELNQKINELAYEKGVTPNALAISWLLRHPAKMQPIVGTTNVERLRGICKASGMQLTREEWYMLYRAAGNILP